ncbi:MAG: M20/M25/M40 family metallo-hydrolase [Firmicutes bacterium]|nr:M20/M25/M40 family metallo-hydrolase [Bacillota bacterium]
MPVNEERIRERFLQLVRLNSPSKKEGAVAEWLKEQFAQLSLAAEVDDSAKETGSETGNIIVRLEGEGPTLLLAAHMDVVSDMAGVQVLEEDGVFRTDGRTILGADDKAGIAAILEAATVLVEEKLPHPSLELVFTTCEEIGLLGAKHLKRESLKAQYGFIFDSMNKPGEIIVNSPSQDEHYYKVLGKAAHAASAEEGVSAIQIAAWAISQIPLGRLSPSTTANIGKISGGTATNIVPELAEIWGEVRSFQDEELEKQSRLMEDSFQKAAAKFGGSVEGKKERSFTGFQLSHKDSVVQLAQNAVHKVGLRSQLVSSGGGSDANVFNQLGIPSVNLGVGMEKPHTKEEFLAARDLVAAAEIALALCTGEAR